jgi:hypothetical protein
MSRSVTEGSCLCGEVRFTVEGDPKWVCHCHCVNCRRNTGSAVATFVGVGRDQVTYTKGERRFYHPSKDVSRGFCGNCGTPLSYEAEKYPDELHLYLCTLDEPDNFVAQAHVFYSQRVKWFEIADDHPRYQRTSREE